MPKMFIYYIEPFFTRKNSILAVFVKKYWRRGKLNEISGFLRLCEKHFLRIFFLILPKCAIKMNHFFARKTSIFAVFGHFLPFFLPLLAVFGRFHHLTLTFRKFWRQKLFFQQQKNKIMQKHNYFLFCLPPPLPPPTQGVVHSVSDLENIRNNFYFLFIFWKIWSKFF